MTTTCTTTMNTTITMVEDRTDMMEEDMAGTATTVDANTDTATGTDTGTVLDLHTDETAPQNDFDDPDLPDFFDGGGNDTTCQWEDGFCTEFCDGYILEYCNDPNCKYDHMSKYCLRHYVISLGLKLDHLRTCPAMRKAHTPEEIKQVALEHAASFGRFEQDAKSEANAGHDHDDAPGLDELADDMSEVDLDAELKKIGGQVYRGSYDDLRMTPKTTAEDLQQWLDGLELGHNVFHVKHFTPFDGFSMELMEVHWDKEHSAEGRFNFYNPDDGPIAWDPEFARGFEKRGFISPKLWTLWDGDTGNIKYQYSTDSYGESVLTNRGLLTDDPTQGVPGVFAITEERTDTVLPVTTGSYIQYKALFNGDDTVLWACDDAEFRKRIRPYIEYYDEDRPLDIPKAKAKAAELERKLHRVIDEGVRPEEA